MYLFLIFFFISRVFVYLLISKTNFFKSYNNDYINNDFIELLLFNHTIPNGHLFIEKIISLINFNSNLIFYFFNLFYSLMLCYFLNEILKKLLKNEKIYRFLILIVISVVLIPYETWRVDHHDHINLFLISYLFWCLFYYINYNKKLNQLVFSLILLNLFYTLGFFYFFLVFIFIIIFKKRNEKNISSSFYYKFSLVFFVILTIFTKNYITTSIFSPTSMGGANLIQRTVHAIGEKKYLNLIEIKKEIFPEWWISLSKKIIKNNNSLSIVDKRISNLAHGNLHENIFTNFKKQKKIIEEEANSEKKILKFLFKDNKNLSNKKWLYEFGYKQNLVSTQYQSYGKQVFIEACKLYSADILIGKIGNKGIILTSVQMISHAGLFPNYYEINMKYSNKFIEYLNNFVRFILIFFLSVTPLIIIKKIKFKNLFVKDYYYLILLISLIMNIVITSTVTCCENPRMFVMQLFVIVLICLMNFNYLFTKKGLKK